MHVAASIPNLLAHELPNLQAAPDDGVERSSLGKSYIKKPLVMGEDGHILLAGNIDGPGLGLELDDNLVENERGVPEWEFPEMWDSFDLAEIIQENTDDAYRIEKDTFLFDNFQVLAAKRLS